MPTKSNVRRAVNSARACPSHGATESIRLPHTLPHMMKEQDVCALLGIAQGTLRNWRVSGCGPRFCKLTGSAVRYPRQLLEDWLNACSRRSTSEGAR